MSDWDKPVTRWEFTLIMWWLIICIYLGDIAGWLIAKWLL